MKKVLVEKCTPQQARVEIKTQLKPANKHKNKVTKVTVPSVTNTADIENTNNIVLFILTESVIMNIDIFKIHYDMNALEIIKNIKVENSSTDINTVIST
jgi:hypothetical protein